MIPEIITNYTPKPIICKLHIHIGYRLYCICLWTILGCAFHPSTVPKNENTAFIPENLHNFKHFDAAFDCLHMINLNEFVPNIYIDSRYAGNDNFMHTPMYLFHTAIAYARKPVTEALKAVHKKH